MGDFNSHLTVDKPDPTKLENAFFTNSGSSNWNHNGYINGDGVVDILHAIDLSNHFGQRYP